MTRVLRLVDKGSMPVGVWVRGRSSIASRCAGFTIVELVTVIILLAILSMVALSRIVQPSAFAPGIITHGLIVESRFAQQLATSRADASVSLTIDRLGDDWRCRISTDVDGVVRTNLFDADNSTLQASSGTADDAIDPSTALLITYLHSGDLDSVQIGASAGDAAMGVDLQVSGDSDRQVCIYSTGYATNGACS